MSTRITRAKQRADEQVITINISNLHQLIVKTLKESPSMSTNHPKEEIKQNELRPKNRNLPISPDVHLIPLPFYDLKATLLQPSSLIPSLSGKLQKQIFKFNLTPRFFKKFDR